MDAQCRPPSRLESTICHTHTTALTHRSHTTRCAASGPAPAGEVILGRSLEELSALMAAVGQPAYRAKQLREGVLKVSSPCLKAVTMPGLAAGRRKEYGPHYCWHAAFQQL